MRSHEPRRTGRRVFSKRNDSGLLVFKARGRRKRRGRPRQLAHRSSQARCSMAVRLCGRVCSVMSKRPSYQSIASGISGCRGRTSDNSRFPRAQRCSVGHPRRRLRSVALISPRRSEFFGRQNTGIAGRGGRSAVIACTTRHPEIRWRFDCRRRLLITEHTRRTAHRHRAPRLARAMCQLPRRLDVFATACFENQGGRSHCAWKRRARLSSSS